jgi:drug/metabolite transporter (DMT)-like permease
MRFWPYIALSVAGACWGLGLPFGALALRETDAAHMILLRFVVAALAVAPWTLCRPQCRRLLSHPAVLLAGGCYGAGFLIEFEGLARTSVSIAALMVGLMPALIAVSAAIGGERVGLVSWVGVGGATLVAGKPGAGGSVLGVLLCLLSLPAFLAWLYAAKRAPAGASPVDVSCAAIVVAAVALVVLVTALHGPPNLHLSFLAWGGIVGQALPCTIGATIAWQLGARRVASAAAGVFINLEPMIGSAIGVALFHDQPTLATVIGGGLILAGSLTTVLGEHRRAPHVSAAKTLRSGDAATPA